MNVIKKLFILICLPVNCITSADLGPLKKYEEIWEYRTTDKKNQEEFAGWWGDANAISRILARLHILQKHYSSLLDAGCGVCVDYAPLKRSCPDMQYLGLDISSTFVSQAKEQGIPVEWGRIQNMPFADSRFDVVYARHILEHLDSYQDAMKEMIRVAAKEVLVVFFMAPDNSAKDKGGMVNVGGYATYQNRYSKLKMEAFLKTIDKVKSWSWQEVKNRDECILHIFVE